MAIMGHLQHMASSGNCNQTQLKPHAIISSYNCLLQGAEINTHEKMYLIKYKPKCRLKHHKLV